MPRSAAVCSAVFDLDYTSYPGADVENTIRLPDRERGSVIMGKSSLPHLVQHIQCSFDERLAVTGQARDQAICLRNPAVWSESLDRADRCMPSGFRGCCCRRNRRSTVFASECSFGRRGTGINTEIAVSLVGGKIGGHDVGIYSGA